MRISVNWLRELADVELSPQALADTLTMAGFEVEEIEDRRTWAEDVVVGKVVQCEPHPNANKLSVCQVDIGGESPLNIVCGAPNAKAEIYVPVATVGTYLPQIDLKIKKAKLRGVPSQGMICSLAEVGLAKESEGIHIFEGDDLQLGSDARPLLGLDDVVLDLTATANRADALSMVGVARELAALTGAPLQLPQAPEIETPDRATDLNVNVSESEACPAYIGSAIANVKIAPSPAWLQHRLQSAGVRPINNVVDITNYILLEWGQPLHAFDRDRLQQVAGSSDLTIGVRFAKDKETLKTLDGQTRELQPQNLLITANDNPVALGGVMGGEDTEVGDDTVNLVLEAALFDPVAIRRSSRAQGLRTEASARYERGVNQAELDVACRRAIALILDLAGGSVVAQSVADARPDPETWSKAIELRLDRVRQVLGQVKLGDTVGDIPDEDIARILEDLGFEIQRGDRAWMVKVPPYRSRDIEREIDLIEEIARLYGYDNFCDTLPSQTVAGYLPEPEKLVRQLREAFRGAGLTELIHYSLVKPGQEHQVELANPLFAEYSALRTELLSGVIDAFQYNLEQGNGALNGFELGRIYWTEGGEFREKDAIAGVMGAATSGNWQRGGKVRSLDWYEAKGILEGIFARLSLSVGYRGECDDSRLHPGRTASLWLQGKRLGTFGQLHPQFRQERDLPDEVYVFQLDLALLVEVLQQPSQQVPKFQPYSTYPASDRDLAFYAPVSVSVAQLSQVMGKAGGKLLESAEVFDEYRGQNVPEGQRSLAFRLTYRAGDRTLTDEDVEPVHQKVRDALVDAFGLELRS